MTDQVVRYGLIGCGEIAVRNCEAVLGASNARLAATFDVQEDLARDLASRQPGARACRSQEELLASEDVDAVIISTPHFLHAAMAIAALKAGKHVLVEKPIARNTAEGKKMLAAAAKARKRLGVCFLQRWRPMIQTARSIVQAGCLGKLTSWVMVELGYKRESYWTGGYSQRAKTDWRLRWETAGGGYLIMNLIHNIDYLRYVSGLEVLKAKSMGGNYNSPPGVEVEDLIAGALSLSNGGIGIIAGASSVPGGRLGENRLVGTRGQIKFGTYGVETLEVYLTEAAQFDGHSVPAAEWTTLTCSADKADRSRTLMVESFGRWIHGEEEFLSPGRDALKSLAACEALYKSAGLVGGKA